MVEDSPNILFRLIHTGSLTVSPTPQFTTSGDLLARNPHASLTSNTFNDHLRWRPINGPLVSFCTIKKAQRYLRYLRRQRVQNITLIAIHKSAFPRVTNAYKWALEHRFKHPEDYHGEFLVEGGGYAGEDYKLLTVMPLPTEGVTRLLRQDEYADDIYRYGGVYDEVKLNELMRAFAQLEVEYL
ncbi:MAG: hypothetical protein L6R39_000667 [Caloplaca ligustica]|nr:MAG: hypothetical protein L6R39_000667 [Caloplaca ligustica]